MECGLIKRQKKITKQETLKKREETVTEEPCADCPGLCCHDLVMVIDPPENQEDLETYKWYVQYDTSFIFILDGKWHHIVKGRCMYLDKKTNLCNIYEERPDKCRDHHPPDCERYGEWYDVWLGDPPTLEDYAYKNGFVKKPKKKSSKTKKALKTKKASLKKKEKKK